MRLSKQIIVDTQTNTIEIVDVLDIIPSLDIEKQSKITEITQLYQKSTQTFSSSALGSPHTYLADDTSMGKFNAEYTFINGNAYDGSSINWYTVEQGGVIHTKEQFNQVWTDGRTYLSNQFNKWDSLVKQINTCADVNSVQVISW